LRPEPARPRVSPRRGGSGPPRPVPFARVCPFLCHVTASCLALDLCPPVRLPLVPTRRPSPPKPPSSSRVCTIATRARSSGPRVAAPSCGQRAPQPSASTRPLPVGPPSDQSLCLFGFRPPAKSIGPQQRRHALCALWAPMSARLPFCIACPIKRAQGACSPGGAEVLVSGAGTSARRSNSPASTPPGCALASLFLGAAVRAGGRGWGVTEGSARDVGATRPFDCNFGARQPGQVAPRRGPTEGGTHSGPHPRPRLAGVALPRYRPPCTPGAPLDRVLTAWHCYSAAFGRAAPLVCSGGLLRCKRCDRGDRPHRIYKNAHRGALKRGGRETNRRSGRGAAAAGAHKPCVALRQREEGRRGGWGPRPRPAPARRLPSRPRPGRPRPGY
jgi:hypothetical protein